MAVATSTAILIAAGTAAAGSAYMASKASSAAGSAPSYQSPPPANYYSYDADGNVTGSQIWNESKNAYEWRPAAKTAEEKAVTSKRQAIKKEMLDNLAETPTDRVKAYADYATNYEKKIRETTDREYGNIVQGSKEAMSSRGLTGSRADVDITSELARRKLASDQSIATDAELAKETLKTNDRSNWLTTLQYVDQVENTDALLNLQKEGMAANMVGASNAMVTKQAENKYLSSAQEAMRKAQAYGAMANALSNMAGTGAMAYGMQTGGTKGLTDTSKTKVVGS